TCLFLAATPEMFEDPDKFPSYKALQDRIETLPNLSGKMSANYRGNVVDLDRTQLEHDDLKMLGQTLVKLHEIAFGGVPPGTNSTLEKIVNQVVTGKYLMARPRLMCRCVTDMLNGELSGDIALAVAARA